MSPEKIFHDNPDSPDPKENLALAREMYVAEYSLLRLVINMQEAGEKDEPLIKKLQAEADRLAEGARQNYVNERESGRIAQIYPTTGETAPRSRNFLKAKEKVRDHAAYYLSKEEIHNALFLFADLREHDEDTWDLAGHDLTLSLDELEALTEELYLLLGAAAPKPDDFKYVDDVIDGVKASVLTKSNIGELVIQQERTKRRGPFFKFLKQGPQKGGVLEDIKIILNPSVKPEKKKRRRSRKIR